MAKLDKEFNYHAAQLKSYGEYLKRIKEQKYEEEAEKKARLYSKRIGFKPPVSK